MGALHFPLTNKSSIFLVEIYTWENGDFIVFSEYFDIKEVKIIQICFIRVGVAFIICFIFKNLSSSISHKKIRLSVYKSLRLYVCTRIYENNSGHILHQHSGVVQPAMQLRITRSPNPSPNAFPKLCERFSARFPIKERDGFLFCSLTRRIFFLKVKHYTMMPVLCCGEVMSFFNTSQSFYQITTLTYVLMDNFCPCFIHNSKDISNCK